MAPLGCVWGDNRPLHASVGGRPVKASGLHLALQGIGPTHIPLAPRLPIVVLKVPWAPWVVGGPGAPVRGAA